MLVCLIELEGKYQNRRGLYIFEALLMGLVNGGGTITAITAAINVSPQWSCSAICRSRYKHTWTLWSYHSESLQVLCVTHHVQRGLGAIQNKTEIWTAKTICVNRIEGTFGGGFLIRLSLDTLDFKVSFASRHAVMTINHIFVLL